MKRVPGTGVAKLTEGDTPLWPMDMRFAHLLRFPKGPFLPPPRRPRGNRDDGVILDGIARGAGVSPHREGDRRTSSRCRAKIEPENDKNE